MARAGRRATAIVLLAGLANCSDAKHAASSSTAASIAGAAGLPSQGTLTANGGDTNGAGATATATATGEPASPQLGYTLFAGAAKTFLIDMNGTVVHDWNIIGFPPKMLPGGSLIGFTGTFPGSYDAVNFLQVDWDGNPAWQFSTFQQASDGSWGARQHHDFQREGNPVGYYAPGQEFVDGGSTVVLAHQLRTVSGVRSDPLDDDVIYRLDANGKLDQVLWYGADHVSELGFDADALNDIATRGAGGTLEWLHGNSFSRVGKNHWFDEGHAEFDPDNLIYSSRNASFVIIISHETYQVVWRIGPDFAGRPEAALGQFAGQHNPHMIPEGLPGAGNILVFDNGGSSGFGGSNNSDRYSRGWSRVLEFNPVTFELIWQYGSDAGEIYSPFISNAQRLPNGNTLITVGEAKRIIEVSPDKQVVWQYESADAIYRSYRVPPEWLPSGVNESAGNYPAWGSP